MRWINPTERASVREGAPGPIVIAGDGSGSMMIAADTVGYNMKEIRKDDPRILCIAFSGSIFDARRERICTVSDDRQFKYLSPDAPLGARWGESGTDIGDCLLEIQQHLRPSKLILISDGGCRNPRRTKRIADTLTFPVDCLYVHHEPHHFGDSEDPSYVRGCLEGRNEGLMRYIARRGQYFRTNINGLYAKLPRCIPPKPQPRITEVTRIIHHHNAAVQGVQGDQPLVRRVRRKA